MTRIIVGVHLDTGDVACEQLVRNFYRLNDVRFGLEGAWYSSAV
jgi:hypothetical protein